ncbi:hypothetical protein KH017_14745 [bacterium]|jgi:hypothetical protein|nr:hypothetical protein C5Q97_18280 [Victivallales bacterium CCUG 44730]MBS5532046.1 hypothetical protein [bacterium]
MKFARSGGPFILRGQAGNGHLQAEFDGAFVTLFFQQVENNLLSGISRIVSEVMKRIVDAIK